MAARDLAPLMADLGYVFQDQGYLRQALTHRSVANERNSGPVAHNERFEFLGDAVIDLVVAHVLMELLPEEREGRLSKLRSMVVSEVSLSKAARRLNLGDYLDLGRGEEQTGGRNKASILADAMEAVLGAMFWDSGYSASEPAIRALVADLIAEAIRGDLDHDHKTRLQEFVQATRKEVPRYAVVDAQGPDHARTFEIGVFLGEEELARASGTSKKEAEQQAASLALDRLAKP